MAHLNKVVRSINAPGGMLCVDIFRRPDGSFGFAQYRRDPEDGRGWQPIGGDGTERFSDAVAATEAARAAVPWLDDLA